MVNGMLSKNGVPATAADHPRSSRASACAPGAGTPRTGEARQLLRAWRHWRGQELVPSRASMNLGDITPLLANLVVLEVRAPDDVVFRLAGTALCRALGRELRGTDYLRGMPEAARTRRIARLQHLVNQPCGALVYSLRHAATGMPFRTEGLSLPIRPAAAGAPMQVVGVVARLPGEPEPYAVAEREIGRLQDDYRFFDIGAGVPAGDAIK